MKIAMAHKMEISLCANILIEKELSGKCFVKTRMFFFSSNPFIRLDILIKKTKTKTKQHQQPTASTTLNVYEEKYVATESHMTKRLILKQEIFMDHQLLLR